METTFSTPRTDPVGMGVGGVEEGITSFSVWNLFPWGFLTPFCAPFAPKDRPICCHCWSRGWPHPSRILSTFGHRTWLSRAASVEPDVGWSPAFVTFPSR